MRLFHLPVLGPEGGPPTTLVGEQLRGRRANHPTTSVKPPLRSCPLHLIEVFLGRRAYHPTTQWSSMQCWVTVIVSTISAFFTSADLGYSTAHQRLTEPPTVGRVRAPAARASQERRVSSARHVARSMSLKGCTCVLLCPFRYPTSPRGVTAEGLTMPLLMPWCTSL